MFRQKKALFLDRDGVLNKPYKDRPPWEISEIKIYRESWQIIQIAKAHDYIPIVVTNQPDAARGHISMEKLLQINQEICKKLLIENSYICTHGYDNMCACRKPKPGMLLKATSEIGLDLSKSYIIGDRLKDIEAGRNAGCKTIYLNNTQSNLANYNVSNHKVLIKLIKKLLIEVY
tara:strand:- start:48 stop:572 length:525 start_codon:yes stop_codon:yes gene_type:complete